MVEDKGGEGELFAFEKLMQVTRRHPLPLRDCGNGQIAVAEIRCYVRHDRAQPRGTDAAPLGDCVAVSCGVIYTAMGRPLGAKNKRTLLREANMREAAARAQIGMAIADDETIKADSLAVISSVASTTLIPPNGRTQA